MEKHITEFVRLYGNKQTADALGVTPSAVTQMLSSGRDIYLVPSEGGYDSYERKPVGRKVRTNS
jgi:hypothetical protein